MIFSTNAVNGVRGFSEILYPRHKWQGYGVEQYFGSHIVSLAQFFRIDNAVNGVECLSGVSDPRRKRRGYRKNNMNEIQQRKKQFTDFS